MMVVIDANIVKGYYQEDVLGQDVVNCPDGLTASPTPLFETLGNEFICYVDEGGIIAHEWELPVDSEWFVTWYADLLISGGVQSLPIKRVQELEKKVLNKGFPKGRDRKYIQLSHNIVESQIASEMLLISEDLDFYDPTKKSGPSKTRQRLLHLGTGPVAKVLKKYNIIVTAVCHGCIP